MKHLFKKNELHFFKEVLSSFVIIIMTFFEGFKVGFPVGGVEEILQEISFRNHGKSRNEEYHQTRYDSFAYGGKERYTPSIMYFCEKVIIRIFQNNKN